MSEAMNPGREAQIRARLEKARRHYDGSPDSDNVWLDGYADDVVYLLSALERERAVVADLAGALGNVSPRLDDFDDRACWCQFRRAGSWQRHDDRCEDARAALLRARGGEGT